MATLGPTTSRVAFPAQLFSIRSKVAVPRAAISQAAVSLTVIHERRTNAATRATTSKEEQVLDSAVLDGYRQAPAPDNLAIKTTDPCIHDS
jgi:hypothetical protein